MSLVLAAALTITGPVVNACSWDRPGANSFQGNVVAAVDRYQDIPAATRDALKKRMAARRYDEIASIRRDSIEGRYRYTDLRDMHFGEGRICRSVTRSKWTEQAQERGLVYCEDGHCIIVPTVCRNVSRITRIPQQKADAAEPGGGRESGLTAAADVPPGNGELIFEAPAAGKSPSSFAGGLDTPPVLPGGFDGTKDAGMPVQPGWYHGGGLPFLVASSPTPMTVPSLPGTPVVPTSPLGPDSPGNPPFPSVPGVPNLPDMAPATPVPEPSTWAMLLAGLGMLVWAGRRRSKRDDRLPAA